MSRWLFALGALALITQSASASAQVAAYERVSVSNSGEQGNALSIRPDMSSDTDKIVFTSAADNLTRGPGGQVFLRTRSTDTTRIVSRASNGDIASEPSHGVVISNNGRYVAFCSLAPNLVAPDRYADEYPVTHEHTQTDVFVRDLRSGQTRRASTTFRGRMANEHSCSPSVTNTGDVLFRSKASNLVRNDSNDAPDVFFYKWASQKLRRISVNSQGAQSDGAASEFATISNDSKVAVFTATSNNLAPNDPPSGPDVFIHLLEERRTLYVGKPDEVRDSSGSCVTGGGSISRTGRYMLLRCHYENPDPAAANGTVFRLYRFDRVTKTFVSATPDSIAADDGGSGYSYGWDLSPSGRYVSWCTAAPYDSEDTNSQEDAFVRDITAGVYRRLINSHDSGTGLRCSTAISPDGREVAFESLHPFSSEDTNDDPDIYFGPGLP